MYERADRIQFLPWTQEGLVNAFELIRQDINKGGNIRDVGDEANWNAQIAVVIFFGKSRDGLVLDKQLFLLDPQSSLSQAEGGTFIGSKLKVQGGNSIGY